MLDYDAFKTYHDSMVSNNTYVDLDQTATFDSK